MNWKNSAAEIDCAIRAFNPWPVAQTTLGEHTLRIWRAQIQPEQTTVTPGTILKADKNGIDVATGNGVLRLLDIQLPNARCLPVSDILNSKADWFKPGALLGK